MNRVSKPLSASGGGTVGIKGWLSTGICSPMWYDTIALTRITPFCTALTRRAEKFFPSRTRSTSYKIGSWSLPAKKTKQYETNICYDCTGPMQREIILTWSYSYLCVGSTHEHCVHASVLLRFYRLPPTLVRLPDLQTHHACHEVSTDLSLWIKNLLLHYYITNNRYATAVLQVFAS